jgi:hypothetical protein
MARRALTVILVAAATSAVFAGLALGEAQRPAAPTASEFADSFVGVANAYAASHGELKRIVHADCVQGHPGHYMCSYAIVRPGWRTQCHLIQAQWRPGELSTIKVTLSGRVAVCDSLAHALHSLR